MINDDFNRGTSYTIFYNVGLQYILITLWHKNIDSKHQGVTNILTGDDDIHTKGYIHMC